MVHTDGIQTISNGEPVEATTTDYDVSKLYRVLVEVSEIRRNLVEIIRIVDDSNRRQK